MPIDTSSFPPIPKRIAVSVRISVVLRAEARRVRARTARAILHVAMIGGFLVAGGLSANAGYLLSPGDTVGLSITGAPELRTKTTIDVDGFARFPLVAPIKAAGLTIDDLQAALRKAMPQQAYRQRTPDGRDSITVIEPNEITLEIDEYRPVYIRGDVAKPGDQRYRPGLTVRQAIALAGGYDIMRFRMDNPFMQSSDLRAEYEQLWTEFARQQTHAYLIRAKLDNTAPPDLVQIIKAPIPAELLSDIVRIETEQIKAQDTDFDRQIAYLEHASGTAQAQIDTFNKPRADAQQSEEDETNYMQRLGQLLNKGVIARNQVADQHRSMLESSQRFLDYSSRIAELDKNRADYDRQVEHLRDDHRAVLLKDLQDCTVQIASLRARLQSVGEKLLYSGAVSSQLVRGGGGQPDVRIFHAGADHQEIKASEDTSLAAGDVVDVSLRAAMMPSAGATN